MVQHLLFSSVPAPELEKLREHMTKILRYPQKPWTARELFLLCLHTFQVSAADSFKEADNSGPHSQPPVTQPKTGGVVVVAGTNAACCIPLPSPVLLIWQCWGSNSRLCSTLELPLSHNLCSLLLLKGLSLITSVRPGGNSRSPS